VPAFFNANTGKVRPGLCNGAILRAPLGNLNAIEPFSWGYRNGYAIRFAPNDHPAAGGLLVGENDAGARPSNNTPDSMHLARQNPDGSPDYHGWPDRYGFLPTSQAVFNPIGGPTEDLCVFDASNPPSNCTSASLAQIISEDVPIRDAFARGPVQKGAALYTLEGDFGFSAANATAPAPEVGHEIKLINFAGGWGQPLALNLQRFAYNKTLRGGIPRRHPRVQPADQCAVRPRWLRLCRRLWRCRPRFWALRPRRGFQEPCRCCAGADPRHRRDLEDLPAVSPAG
jgi:hypothetical protein